MADGDVPPAAASAPRRGTEENETSAPGARSGAAPPASAAHPYDDEETLLAALRAGREDAFEHLVRTRAGRMLAVARRLLGSDDEAEDAVQEAFLSAFRSLERFEGQARLATWLHRITVNAALMRLRTRRRKPEQPIEELLPRFLEDGHRADPGGPWQPAAALERAELRALVRRSIERLPETHRTVLLLRDIEGLDTAETAEALGVGRAVVKTRLHRARQALRALLDPHLQAPARAGTAGREESARAAGRPRGRAARSEEPT